MQVAGDEGLQGVLDAVSPQAEHAHVGDVEDAAVLPHRVVFQHQTAELHGHVPAGERHQATARIQGRAMEGGVSEGRGVGHGGGECAMAGILWIRAAFGSERRSLASLQNSEESV